MCVGVPYACLIQVSGQLEPELQTVLSHHAGAGNQTRVPSESNQCSKWLVYVSGPIHFYFSKAGLAMNSLATETLECLTRPSPS